MRNKWIVLFCSLLLTTALWGCGSGGGSGGSDVGGRTTEPGVIGSTACQQCHAQAHSDASAVNRTEATVGDQTGIDLLVEHLAADQTIFSVLHNCEDCHGGGQFHANGPLGNPIPIRQPRAADCAECHDQVDQVTAWGNHIVPVGGDDQTACSACHTPLTLDVSLDCMTCHSTAPITAVSEVSAKVTASMHSFGAQRFSANCQRCHTVEGFLNLLENGVNPSSNANYTAFALTLDAGTAPTCAACHEPHAGDLRAVPGWDPNMNGVADQFDLCTACHNLYDNNGDLVTTYHHQTTWYRNIQSTHYDNPATGYGLVENAIEGYVVRANGENPCFDCHGHELRTNTRRHTEAPQADPTYGPTIHTDWANSRHGGALLEAKVDAAANPGTETVYNAVVAAGRFDEEGHGWSWTHYDWDAANRQSCQRCHTSTGAANFFTNPTTYVAANNDFSHLDGWVNNAGTITPSGQNEMLYCWGCHVSVDTGEVRDTGALTLNYTNGAQASYPDSAGSNVCIACHSGRETGDSIKLSAATFTDTGFINSHYLAAGGTIFATTGYHYEVAGEELDYANETGPNLHQNLGYGSAVPSGNTNFDLVSDDYTNGPCVTCHFDSSDIDGLDRSHTLSPFTETATEGLVLNEVCVVCHTSRGVGDAANTWYGTDFTVDQLVAGVNPPHKGRYLAALEALRVVLADNGIVYSSGYPYFSTRNWTVGGTRDGKDVMGAAFNYNLLAHDPNGVAHNRHYTRRLIYDSIDFMDDGTINDSVLATLNALDDTVPYKTGALNYLTFAR